MNNSIRLLTTLLAVLVMTACGDVPSPAKGDTSDADNLAGAWRSQIRFSGGALAEIKDQFCSFSRESSPRPCLRKNPTRGNVFALPTVGAPTSIRR